MGGGHGVSEGKGVRVLKGETLGFPFIFRLARNSFYVIIIQTKFESALKFNAHIGK